MSVHVGNRRTKRQDFIIEFDVWLNLRSGKEDIREKKEGDSIFFILIYDHL